MVGDIPPLIVDIAPTDTGFYSWGCGEWTSGAASLAAPGEPFGAGAYLVGPEVAPGRYRSDSLGYCFWERLGGFGGRPGDVVQSVGIEGADAWPLVVAISLDDAGFRIWDCGEWTPVP